MTKDDYLILSAMIDQMNIATEREEAAIDEALNDVAASNERIANMDALAEQRDEKVRNNRV